MTDKKLQKKGKMIQKKNKENLAKEEKMKKKE